MFSHLLKRSSRLWSRLTEPDEHIADLAERRQAQLLAAILVTLVFLTLLTVYLPILFTLVFDPGNLEEFYRDPVQVSLYLGVTAFWIGLLVMRHQISQRWLALLLVISSCTAIFLSGISAPAYGSYYILYYLFLPIMLSSVFLNRRDTIVTMAVNLVVLVLLPNFVPGLSSNEMPVFFILTASLVIFLVERYRMQLENDRKVALIASEERYRKLFEGNFDAITVHENGVLHNANPAFERMFDYTNDELIGTTLLQLTVPDSIDDVSTYMMSMTHEHYEVKGCRKDGTILDLEIASIPYVQEGRALRIATIRDVTERKQAEEQRFALALEQEKVKLMRRFISDASHDLRTPLTVILNSAQLLRLDPDPEHRNERLERIEHQVLHMTAMIENLLSVSRLDKAANNQFVFEISDLNHLLAENIAEQQSNADTQGVELVSNLTHLPLPVKMDGEELRRALRQLIQNAINYTLAGGRVEVRSEKRNHRVFIQVIDNGVGIAPENQQKIFEAFYRADNARQAETGGMGLGLNICKRIIEVHSGQITVDSRLGEGSTFTVKLPLEIDVPSINGTTQSVNSF